MKILLCGGGTGGHITPIIAIAHELKKKQPNCEIIYVGERGGKFSHLTKNLTSIDSIKRIYAGKFRRYYGESWIKRIFDYQTNALNFRDFFYVILGFIQSYIWLGKEKPDVIFIKGGYVCLPIGLAAHLRRIPYITHDSDSVASITNQIVGKWATYNATGMPPDLYSYPKAKIRFVGIPISNEFVPENLKDKELYREEINVPRNSKMILVTGGSQGGMKINQSFSSIAKKLLQKNDDLYIVHQVGAGNSGIYNNFEPTKRLRVYEFLPDLYKYSTAADLVIARSGATTIAELAVQGKPAILIPNPFLTGGHQTKNAKQLSLHDGAVVLSEGQISRNPDIFFDTVNGLLNDRTRQKELSQNIKADAKPDAASDIVVLLLSIKENK